MSNKVYDALKYVAQIVLPALATLYLPWRRSGGFRTVSR